MYLECTCVGISQDKWDALMKGARRCSRQVAVKAAVEVGILDNIEAKKELILPRYNPYSHKRTKTHIIYIHSGVEHFIKL